MKIIHTLVGSTCQLNCRWILCLLLVACSCRDVNEKTLARVRPAWASVEPFRGWVDYPSSDGLIVHAYVFKPEGQGPFKLFVYTPGGGKSAAIEKQMHMLLERGRLEPFLNAGYMVMVPAYRGAGDFGPEYQNLYDYGGKEVDDVVWGARHLIEIGLADPAHVYFSGVSHGAKVSMMIAERYRLATAVAPISGDYDISSAVAGVKVPGYSNALQPPKRIPVMRESILREHPGFSDEEIVAEARRRDPLLHVNQVQCPVFLLAGEKDYIVGHYVAAKMKQELLKHHKSVIDKMYFGPKTNHGMQYLDTPQAAEMWQDILNFFEGRSISGTGTIPLAALESDYPQPTR